MKNVKAPGLGNIRTELLKADPNKLVDTYWENWNHGGMKTKMEGKKRE